MKTFSVKNFERFQHYKDRSPPWIKLYNELLDDYEFGRLPDASKMHLIAIWLLASRSENKIPYDAAWVARRINANTKVDLTLLACSGFIVVDQSPPDVEQDASKTQAECLSREREEGETEERREEKKETREDALLAEFDSFWEIWPNKVGKPAALKSYRTARKRGFDPIIINAGVSAYIRGKPPDRPWLNPATFLNQNRWEDRPAQVTNGKASPFDAAYDSILDKLNTGFGRPASEERILSGESETDARLLAYRGSQ